MKPAEIVTYGTDLLRQTSEEIAEFDEETKSLLETMYEAMVKYGGLGLAAPQIGISKRVFVYDVGEGQHALINPKIVKRSGEEYSIEGCLSIPGLQGEVPRAYRVTVAGIDENGNKVRIKAEGLLARVFQHEIDHLDGMMFVDRADPATLETIPVDGEADEEE